MRHVTLSLVMFLGAAAHVCASSGSARNAGSGKAWFRDAGYGVFVHYLGGGPGWNDRVNSFDVERFADQIAQTGAAYLVFTLGQNSGYYCSPNATYEKYAGYDVGRRCSARDLPMEIADALRTRGIGLMLYLPSRSPQQDAKAMAGLNDVHERKPAPQEFTRKWSDVIREWSLRYGTKVSGWWFDGSYNRTGWDDLSKPCNWNTWAAAARAGNPDSLLAFNPGASIAHAFNKLTDQQDYTAGEQNEFGATPESNPAQGGLQWHLLSYLGSRWDRADGPRKSDEWMTDYLRKVNEQGGVVTLDVHCSADGALYGPHFAQLIAVRQAMYPRAFYVATDGDDTGPGTVDEPFASLEKARDTIRRSKTRAPGPEGITVYVRQGAYFRTSSFSLAAQDSGAAGRPITYRAFPGEQVRLIGGHELRPQWFAPVAEADPAFSRLDSAAQGQCLKVSLSAHGITSYGQPLQMELSFNAGLLPLSRWPNEGFVRTTSARDDITFGYDDPRPARWLAAADACACGYWRHGWANRIEQIAAIDVESKTITLAKAPGYGIQADKPYYVLNLLEEIDQPGEWYLDREKGILYLWPPEDFEKGELLLSALAAPLISLKDVSHVRFEGLVIEMGADEGIDISGGQDNLIRNCTIRNVRDGGISLSGLRNGVTGCEISGIGGAGVSVSGGDRHQLTAGENFVRNCRIHDFGRWQRTYAPAIRLNGVGCIAANNVLYDAPHSAILFGGNEHLIELNEIYGVCYEVDDAGSIYCGRDWGLRGNVIRHNFFHHITSHLPGSNGVHAVYLDDCASGITVFGNTFYEISGRAIMCGGGRDNAIENNVIARCGAAHFTDRRGKVWIDKDESWKLLDKIKRYNYTEPPWSTRYPRLAHILDNGYEQAKEPEGCVIRFNLGWQNKRWLQESSLGAPGGFKFYAIEHNIEDQDPLFVDEADLNLALRDDSPAYQLRGFQRIPFEDIGPQEDPGGPVAWPLARRAGFVADPNVLPRGVMLRQTAGREVRPPGRAVLK